MHKFENKTLKKLLVRAGDILAPLQIRNGVDDVRIRHWIVSREGTGDFGVVKPDKWLDTVELQSFEKELNEKYPEGLKRDKTSILMIKICL